MRIYLILLSLFLIASCEEKIELNEVEGNYSGDYTHVSLDLTGECQASVRLIDESYSFEIYFPLTTDTVIISDINAVSQENSVQLSRDRSLSSEYTIEGNYTQDAISMSLVSSNPQNSLNISLIKN